MAEKCTSFVFCIKLKKNLSNYISLAISLPLDFAQSQDETTGEFPSPVIFKCLQIKNTYQAVLKLTREMTFLLISIVGCPTHLVPS